MTSRLTNKPPITTLAAELHRLAYEVEQCELRLAAHGYALDKLRGRLPGDPEDPDGEEDDG